jgi:serine/threonine protein phosphatase PrpC
VAALSLAGTWVVGWVGDSRAYLVGAGPEQLLTRDDSWVEDVVDSGAMDREHAMASRFSHVITQCLGMADEDPKIHVQPIEVPPGRGLLLCSDGLWNAFETEGALGTLAEALVPGAEALHVCRELVARSNAQGGKDNITAALYMGERCGVAGTVVQVS